MKPLLTVVIAALSLALIACGADAEPSHSHGHSKDDSLPAAQGSQILLSLDELKEVSDLVVKGSPTASTDIQKGLTDSRDYPENLKTLHAGQVLDIKKFTFTVDQYYKGLGASEITIMVDTTGGAPVSLDVGTTYVLYLFQSDTEEGRAYWDHGYLIQGWQGLWVVDGDNATRQIGDVRRTLSLHALSASD